MHLEMGNQKFEERPKDSRWYAVYTKHQHEKKSAELLTRKGIETYLPLYCCVHRWKDRKKRLELPLFPGYMFFRSTLEDRTEVLSTPGIFFIVESAGRACAIPDRDIESLQTVTRDPALIEPHPFVRSGDYVRIHRGPLAGVCGMLTRLKNQDRVVLCVELLRKAASVEIDIADVEKIDEHKAPKAL